MTTTAGRRLAKLEDALQPREAVLAWLAELDEVPHISAYARQIAEVPIEAAPMSVIARRVGAVVRDDMKGKPRDAIEDAVYRATGDALFLFTLVFQVNIDVVDMARVEGLRAAAVAFWMGCLLGGPRDDDIPRDEVANHHRELTSAWATWRWVVDELARDVLVATQVRATIADRYYAGRDVLFADARTDWEEHVQSVELLKGLADTIGSSDQGKAARSAHELETASPSVETRVEDRVAWLTDQAKIRAYEILGDRPKAVAIMERRILAEESPGAHAR